MIPFLLFKFSSVDEGGALALLMTAPFILYSLGGAVVAILLSVVLRLELNNIVVLVITMMVVGNAMPFVFAELMK
ncbi:MAG: hypothetical protein AAGC81_10895 [Pseudomonadota bacterium]